METKAERIENLLSPYQVLDLTDEKGFLCGRILADLGADVIKVERPGGDPSRYRGPFYHDEVDPEKSLYWWAFNANKRGITLDINKAVGKEIFKNMAGKADFLIESFSPGYMDSLGLGYTELSKINPRIIVTSITPFGQTGPYKDLKASDIVIMAMSGFMHLCGDSDRPPVRISFPQSYLNGGAEAAQASLIAHCYRRRTGNGQHVDVSLRDSITWLNMNFLPFWQLARRNLKRAGPRRPGLAVDATQRVIWPCKDGYVAFNLAGGSWGAVSNTPLIKAMDEEGVCPDFLKEMNWSEWDIAKASQAQIDRFARPILKFFASHTKAELNQKALELGINLYPVSDVNDIIEDPHLASRAFWQELEHPELDETITYPGAFSKSTEAHSLVRWRAPLISEHNEDFFEKEMGLTKKEILNLSKSGII